MKYILILLAIISLNYRALSQNVAEKIEKPDTMKKEFLGLRTVVYKVGDLNEAKQWYAKAFGIEPYFDEAFYVGFNIGGYELGLLPEEKPGKEKVESVFAYWGVENVKESFDKLISAGAKAHEAPHDVGVTVASVYDPWGNIIGIIYNPHFKLPEK